MRVLATVTLSAVLIIAAPVVAGLHAQSDQRVIDTSKETVISKTSPDGTWPFALKEENNLRIVAYTI
jgi:hypothetical protein